MPFQEWLMAYCWLVTVAATEVTVAVVTEAVVTEVETAEMAAMVVTVVTVEMEAEGKEMGPEQHPAMGQGLVMDQVEVFMSRAQVKDPAIKFASMSPEPA